MPFVFYGGAEVLLLYFTLWTLAENLTDLMFIACSMRRCLCRGLEIEEDVFARSDSCNTGRVLRAQRQRTWCIITLYFLMASSASFVYVAFGFDPTMLVATGLCVVFDIATCLT
eukprot:s8463_g2.t1